MRTNNLLNHLCLLTLLKETCCRNSDASTNRQLEDAQDIDSSSSVDQLTEELERLRNYSEMAADYIENSTNRTYLQQITDTTTIDMDFKHNIIFFLFDKAITFTLNNKYAISSVIKQFYVLREANNLDTIHDLIRKSHDFLIELGEQLGYNDSKYAFTCDEIPYNVQRDLAESIKYFCLTNNIPCDDKLECSLAELKEDFTNADLETEDSDQEQLDNNCENKLTDLYETIYEAGIEIKDFMVFLDLCKILVNLSTYLSVSFEQDRDAISAYVLTLTCFFIPNDSDFEIPFQSFSYCIEYVIHMIDTAFFSDDLVKLDFDICLGHQYFQVTRLIGVLYGIQHIINNNDTRDITLVALKTIDNEVLQVIQTCQETITFSNLLLSEAISANELNQQETGNLAAYYSEYIQNTMSLFSDMHCLNMKTVSPENP